MAKNISESEKDVFLKLMAQRRNNNENFKIQSRMIIKIPHIKTSGIQQKLCFGGNLQLKTLTLEKKKDWKLMT